MVEDRVGRRALLAAGSGLLASLAGCGSLFIEPESTTTPQPNTATSTPTATASPTATATPAPTPEPTPTAAPLPSDAVEVRTRRISIRRSQLEKFALATYGFEVENTGERTIRDVEFRVNLRYERDDISRVVGTDYPRFRFDPAGDTDDENEDAREGLQPGEVDAVNERLRFERDGRAEGSTAARRFELVLSIRRVRYR